MSGRVGNLVYVQSARYGPLVRAFSPPRNPQTIPQQANRQSFGAVASQWRALPPEKRVLWCLAAASLYVVNNVGRQVRLSGYHLHMRLNAARAHLGLSRYEEPPSNVPPSFDPNPVDAVVVTNTDGDTQIKLHVSGPLAEHTLVEAAAPVSAGVSCVQQYRYTGLLPAPDNGYSDVTDLVVGRFGVLTPGKVLFLRIRQQINGWMDVPKVLSVLIPAA